MQIVFLELVPEICNSFVMIAGMDFLLVCTYEKDGVNPELVLYKKR